MAARIPVSEKGVIKEGSIRDAKLPFVGALQIVCRHKGIEHPIIEHAIAWIGCRNSYSAVPLGEGHFLVSGDLATAEIRDLQIMAVAPGPSIDKLMRMGAPAASKDIHMGTGRVPIRSLLEVACGGSGVHTSNSAFMNVGYDPVQPDVEILVRTEALPGSLGAKYGEMNAKALKRFGEMEKDLIPMSQDRINQYNMRQNLIAKNFVNDITVKGLKRHPEGVMQGLFVSSIGNTLVDLLTNMDVIMQEKVRLSKTTVLDAFGICAALFKLTGLCPRDTIDERVAADCLSNVGGLLASDLTYASDIKPILPDKTPKDLHPLLRRAEGDGYVIEVYGESMKEEVPAYTMSEDIMVPFSDIYLRSAHAGESLFNHLDPMKRRDFVAGYRKGDCEDLSHFGVLSWSYAKRLCVRLSDMCGAFYEEYPDVERKEPAVFQREVFDVLKSRPELSEWSEDEIRGVLRQCGDFGRHIWDTEMRTVLMTAKAPKMSSSGKVEGGHPTGHCAAMLVRRKRSGVDVEGADKKADSVGVTSSLENEQSNFDRILTEMTAAIRIESFVDREEVKGRPPTWVSQKIRSSDMKAPISEAAFYNQCTVMMAPSRTVKPWLHVGKLDGIFWHVVSTIGDTILVKDSVIGVPITQAVSSLDNSLKGVKVDYTEDEKKETLLMARYALPPIESNTAMIRDKVVKPLARSLYDTNNIPISYIVDVSREKEIDAWISQSTSNRYHVKLGNKMIAVHQMNKCSMNQLKQSLMKKGRVDFVDSI